MGIFNLKTGKKVEDVNIVSDLDRMVADSVAFRLHGKVHKIKPITVKEFYEYSNAIARLKVIEKADKVKKDEIVDAYYNLIHSVVDTINLSDVENMTQAQAAALFSLILDAISGKAQVDEKKNSLTLA